MMPSKKLNKRTTYVDDDEGVEDDGKERFGNACPLAIGVELALGGMSLRKQRGGLGVREEQFLLGNLLTGGGVWRSYVTGGCIRLPQEVQY